MRSPLKVLLITGSLVTASTERKGSLGAAAPFSREHRCGFLPLRPAG
jgi:hypothetical protein